MSFSTRIFSDESKFKEGGVWSIHKDDIAKNYPACKTLFHFNDVASGQNTWSDRVGDLIIVEADQAGLLKDDVLGVRRSSTVTITGDMPVPGTKDMGLIWQGAVPTANVAVELGDSYSGAGLGLSGSSAQGVARDASNFLATTTLSGPPTYPLDCLSLHIDQDADEIRKAGANSDGVQFGTSLKGVGSGTLTGDWPALVNQVQLPLSATAGVVIMAFFVFGTPPDDTFMQLVTRWMAANPGKLCPLLAGRT